MILFRLHFQSVQIANNDLDYDIVVVVQPLQLSSRSAVLPAGAVNW